VKVCAICPGVHDVLIAAEKEERARRIEGLKALLKAAGELGAAGVIVVPVFGGPPFPDLRPWKSDVEIEREYFLHVLAEEILPVAAREGTAIFLEPLNRYEDHMLNRLGQAVSLIEEGRFSRVKVAADFFHMNIEEPRIEESILQARDYIGHVHLADSHRFQPGDGHLDFAPGLAALKEIGYDGYLAFECRVRGKPEEAYPESVRYIRGLLSRVLEDPGQ
ncbi:MAG: sugar phosphate isomerase/epimerase, partial [Planifilum fulgidum]